MIKEYIIKKCLDEVIARLGNIVGKGQPRYIITKSNMEEAIAFHSKQIENWSNEINFRDLENPKPLLKAYIPLDLFLTPRRQVVSEKTSVKKTSIDALLEKSNRNLIILGHPGAGKTTSVKHICQTLLYKDNVYPNFNFPIVIRLRELTHSENRKEETVLEKLCEILGIMIIFKEKIRNEDNKIETHRIEIREENGVKNESKILQVIAELLDELKVLLILDGFDEVPEGMRVQILSDIKQLSISLNTSRFILTSRVGEFHYSIDNTSEYELCPLNDKQIERFTEKWLKNKSNNENFIYQLNKSPFKDAAMRPLTLAHLLAIYEREKQIPDKPKTVYRKIINLLLEEWDLQRTIIRKSRYGNFEVDRKLEFLSHMSYFLTLAYNTTIFSKDEFEIAYFAICDNFNLPKFESKNVVNEIETHNGLFIQAGYEEYEFAHKSMQEYLTATHLVKLPFIPLDEKMLTIPNEIALCIAISSNPTIYFASLVFNILDKLYFSIDFLHILFNRIIIEKVDFNQNPILAFSFLHLYTKLLYRESKEKRTLEIFKKLYSIMPAFQLSLRNLLDNYYEMHNSTDNNIVLKNKQPIANDITNWMPDLCMPKCFRN